MYPIVPQRNFLLNFLYKLQYLPMEYFFIFILLSIINCLCWGLEFNSVRLWLYPAPLPKVLALWYINKPIILSVVTECTKASTSQALHGNQRQVTWVTRVVRMPMCCHGEEVMKKFWYWCLARKQVIGNTSSQGNHRSC